MMIPQTRLRGPTGLDELRRSGAVTELLFLYECATTEPTKLRPLATRLHVTVQAVSHIYRQLLARGEIEIVNGRYRPTVSGVAWLHETLDRLAEDLTERLAHLHIIRSTRAIAQETLRAGELVGLEIKEGLLTARRGPHGSSRGRAATDARRGSLVEVTDLEGIVPIRPAGVAVRTLSESELSDPGSPARLRAALAPTSGLVAALGLEVYALLTEAGISGIARFAVAEVGREATQVGVPVTIIVAERDLPHLLAEFASGPSPTLDVSPLFARPRKAIEGRRLARRR